MKCKSFRDSTEVCDEINTWLDLLGSDWKVSHVVTNQFRVIVFVEYR